MPEVVLRDVKKAGKKIKDQRKKIKEKSITKGFKLYSRDASRDDWRDGL
jgi:hypothetical protein